MTLSGLLSFWRERWLKPGGAQLQVPYLQSAVTRLLEELRISQFWELPGVGRFSLIVGLLFLGLSPLVELNFNSHILFSFVLLSGAFFLRRYPGPTISLALACLCLLVVLRYLRWRFQATLPTGGLELFFGLTLLTLEALAWLSIILNWARTRWPLLQTPAPMPLDTLQWPVVDAVLICTNESLAQIESSLHSLRAQDWPTNKLQIHLIGPPERTDLGALAKRHQVSWAASNDAELWLSQQTVLDSFAGQLVWVIHAAPALAPHQLQACAGWMTRDSDLKRISTPPRKGAIQQLWTDSAPSLNLDLMRRSDLLALAQNSALEGHGLARSKWQAAGLRCAWLIPLPDASLCGRVDPPHGRLGLGWRLWAQGLAQGLAFYAPLARVLLILTPALCLVLSFSPITTSLLHLLVYALPALILARIADSAQQSAGRLPLFRFIHEWLLEYVLLWRTALAFSITGLRRQWQAHWQRSAPRLGTQMLPSSLRRREGWIIFSQLAALCFALPTHFSAHAVSVELFWFYVAWAVYNILSAVARLALAKEQALVQQEAARRATQEAVLQIDGGRLLRAQTVNFPQPTLQLQWLRPSEISLAEGDIARFSILYKGYEHDVSGEILQIDAQGITLRITAKDLSAYQAFGTAVFSRDVDWPNWLAPKKADQILPARAHKLYVALETLFYDFVITHKSLQALLSRFRLGSRTGKSKHG